MSTNRVARLRLRYSLILIILATLPCYCAGLLAVLLAPKPDIPANITPTVTHGFTLAPNPTFTQFPTFTLFPTWTSSPTRTDTPMASETPTPSLTPFLPPTASDTPIPSPSDTYTPEPTMTTTPTPTITETPPSPSETATPTITNTPGVIIVTLVHTSTAPVVTQAWPEITPSRAPSP